MHSGSQKHVTIFYTVDMTFWQFCQFLPRDASAERGDATVSRPSVCP